MHCVGDGTSRLAFNLCRPSYSYKRSIGLLFRINVANFLAIFEIKSPEIWRYRSKVEYNPFKIAVWEGSELLALVYVNQFMI